MLTTVWPGSLLLAWFCSTKFGQENTVAIPLSRRRLLATENLWRTAGWHAVQHSVPSDNYRWVAVVELNLEVNLKAYFGNLRNELIYIYIYRVSQEECARLQESVPYVKVYWYNPKHLCPKLNGYGDNGQEKCGLLAGPHTVPVSWPSYPFPSLSVVSYDRY